MAWHGLRMKGINKLKLMGGMGWDGKGWDEMDGNDGLGSPHPPFVELGTI